MTPEYYLQVAKYQWDDVHVYVPYFSRLPEVTISVCPFTIQKHTQKLDTYSLYGWHNRYSKGVVVRYSPDGYTHSDHLYETHTFIHLNGDRPTKRNLADGSLTSAEPEVPFVSPRLLAEDIDGYGVIHSIPITKIRGNVFKDAYTLYVISYYAHDVSVTLDTLKHEWTSKYPDWRAQRISDWWEIATDDHWNLKQWVASGRLKWLTPEYTLSSDPDTFPYNNIKGKRHGYTYDATTKTFEVYNTLLY